MKIHQIMAQSDFGGLNNDFFILENVLVLSHLASNNLVSRVTEAK